ncbi:MAG: hypothetical protein AAFS10_15625, partial [Myxococcota bacterium]
REISIKHSSAAGVAQAFRGHKAGGGTDYGAGVQALSTYKPNADEDALFLFVGDQLASTFDKEVRHSGLDPVAFGMLHIHAPGLSHQGRCVEETASLLGIPCFAIDEAIFDDPYAVTRTLKHLIASTPASASIQRRRPLIETILNTKLLQRPVWA